MAVYIDDYKANFRKMIMCHMIADTHEELLSMADKINLNHKWIQQVGTYREHFDVCLSFKAAAIKNGAIAITARELGRKLLERRSR
jgi:hypothetical protein